MNKGCPASPRTLQRSCAPQIYENFFALFPLRSLFTSAPVRGARSRTSCSSSPTIWGSAMCPTRRGRRRRRTSTGWPRRGCGSRMRIRVPRCARRRATGCLTGRYNWRSRWKKSVFFDPHDKPLIESDDPNVARLLKDNGYTHGMHRKVASRIGWQFQARLQAGPGEEGRAGVGHRLPQAGGDSDGDRL